MNIYSINDTPEAKEYFPAGNDIIIELFDESGTLVPIETTVEFSGDTTDQSLVISNIANTSLLLAGQVVEGAGIQKGSKIVSKTVDSVTMDKIATISDLAVSLKAYTPCTPGVDDTNIYYWSFANFTTQPTDKFIGHWKMRTSDDSYPETRTDFHWGGWPDGESNITRISAFPTDKTQSTPRIKGDNIDFIFDFQEDVSGWKFMFTLVDPNGTFELKKGSANVTGGSDLQISVEPTSTISRVIAKALKNETSTLEGSYGNYELQFITDDDKQGSKPGIIVFKDELIESDWVLP